jgi:hypothetical protein
MGKPLSKPNLSMLQIMGGSFLNPSVYTEALGCKLPYEDRCHHDIYINEARIYRPGDSTFSEGSATSTPPPGSNSRGGGGGGNATSTATPPTSTAPPTPTTTAFWTLTATLAIAAYTQCQGSPSVYECQQEIYDTPRPSYTAYNSYDFKKALYTSCFRLTFRSHAPSSSRKFNTLDRHDYAFVLVKL